MSVLAILLAAEANTSARPLKLSGPGELPRPAVIVFWASWCGPCRAELRRIPALATAAKPLPLVLLALDPPATARAALANARIDVPVFADNRAPASVLTEWAGAGAALPLAVSIDRAGRVCGVKRGLLGTDQLHDWIHICSR